MNEILFEVLKLAVMVTGLVITRYLIPWIKSQIDIQSMQTVTEWTKYAVLSAQQTLQTDSGEERKAIVTKFLQEFLTAKNISISDEQLDTLIEAAVKEMKMSENRNT
ncbi:MAG: phage holin [Lachnospiraceae bacterium]|nr:phage holin [Lachnospiraceae bacterium]